MRNIALEFRQRLASKDFNGASGGCKSLLGIYQNPKFSIPINLIEVKPQELLKVYKNKIEAFLSLYKYLSMIEIKESDCATMNWLLSSSSEVEAEVFIMLLTLTVKPKTFNFKEFKELSKCFVQKIPKGSSRVILEFNEQGIKELRGNLNDALRQPLKKYLSFFEGTIDCFQTNKKLYIHDFWSPGTAVERLWRISRWSKTTNIETLTPYYFENTKYIDFHYKGEDLILKPFDGMYNEVYKYTERK